MKLFQIKTYKLGGKWNASFDFEEETDFNISETNKIIEYLENKFPELKHDNYIFEVTTKDNASNHRLVINI